jgi:hypothetical protein
VKGTRRWRDGQFSSYSIPRRYAALRRRVKCPKNSAVEQFAERLLDEVLGWPDNGSTREQADDITLVVVDIGNMAGISTVMPHEFRVSRAHRRFRKVVECTAV